MFGRRTTTGLIKVALTMTGPASRTNVVLVGVKATDNWLAAAIPGIGDGDMIRYGTPSTRTAQYHPRIYRINRYKLRRFNFRTAYIERRSP